MQLEPRDYLNILLKRWWLILLVAVSAAAAGYAVSKLQTPVYQASTHLLITPSRPDNGLILFAKQNSTSYPSRLQSRDFVGRALAESDNPSVQSADPDTVLGALKVQVGADQLTLNLTLDDTNGQRAA